MKIFLLNYEYPPLGGGGGIETRDLAEELVRRGHTVHVLTTAYDNLPLREVQNNVVIHRVRVWGRTKLPTATLRSMITFVPAALIAGIRILRDFRPDVLNAHFVIPTGIPAVVLSWWFRVPLVLTLIGGDIYDPSKGVSPHRHAILRWVVSWVVHRAHALTAISQDTRERAMQHHRAPSHIEVVPLGLVPPVFQKKSREALGFDPKQFHFITVGRLIPRKGYRDLLNALAHMEQSRVVLHILGDGPLVSSLAEECARLNVADRVRFHGWVAEEEKYALLAAADAYVSASIHEGFGICFLEAMYVGLPIIATDTGGQTDFLVGGKHAILVPPKRPEQLAHAMDWVLRDSALRSAMAHQNVADVAKHLIGETARRYEEIFRRVIRT